MNYNLTELVYILDMSGSMAHLAKDTIGGYNSMIEQQKKLNSEKPGAKANVTTVLFDDRYILLHDRANLDEMKEMTSAEYVPTGMTAMLDAIGKTVVSVGQKLAAMPEDERPGLVSVTIITDGYENASKEYTWNAIRNMIKEQKEKYSWLFSFVGANIDVDKTVYDLGIDRSFAASYTASEDGIESVYCSLSKGIEGLRGSVMACAGSLADGSITVNACASKTMTSALAEII